MNRRYQYYAIVTESHPHEDEPVGVVRRWVDQDGQAHDEGYSPGLTWIPTDDLVALESGHAGAEARLISEEAAQRFEAVQRSRFHPDNPADGKYDYLAWVDADHPADNPVGVIRTWVTAGGTDREQMYSRGIGGWVPSFVRDDIGRGHVDGTLLPITAEDVERLTQQG
ncbi:hypothetical protein ACWGE0_20355 [Lentzea sp. NPDC054927]